MFNNQLNLRTPPIFEIESRSVNESAFAYYENNLLTYGYLWWFFSLGPAGPLRQTLHFPLPNIRWSRNSPSECLICNYWNTGLDFFQYLSSLFLNIFSVGKFTTVSGSLFHLLDTLNVNAYFLLFDFTCWWTILFELILELNLNPVSFINFKNELPCHSIS